MSVLSFCENFTKLVVQLCKRTEKCPLKCISREIKTGDQTQIYREEGVLVITLTLWQHEINTEVGCKMCIAQTSLGAILSRPTVYTKPTTWCPVLCTLSDPMFLFDFDKLQWAFLSSELWRMMRKNAVHPSVLRCLSAFFSSWAI